MGVSSALYLDHAASLMPSTVKLHGVPQGGFTIDHPNFREEKYFIETMEWTFLSTIHTGYFPPLAKNTILRRHGCVWWLPMQRLSSRPQFSFCNQSTILGN